MTDALMMTLCSMPMSFTVGSGREVDVLHGGGARADGAEHLVAVEGDLHRATDGAGSHGGEDHVRPGGTLGAEAAPSVRALDADIVERECRGCGRQWILTAGDVLRGVVEVELVSIPCGGGGVGLHGIVVLDGRGVGLVDRDCGFGLGGGEVSAFLVVGLLAVLTRERGPRPGAC